MRLRSFYSRSDLFDYSAGCSSVALGVGNDGAAGAVCCWFFNNKSRSLLFVAEFCEGMSATATKENNTIAAASVHVDFSRKSVVLRTPISAC